MNRKIVASSPLALLLAACGAQISSSTALESAVSTSTFNVSDALGLGTSASSAEVRTSSDRAAGSSALAQAPSSFPGTGGPGGAFVYRVRAQPGGPTVFNTVFDTITDETGSLTANCVNGVIDVYDLVIDPGAVLQLRGPNPCMIRVLHDVQINGEIVLRGGKAPGVTTYSTSQAQAGGVGNAGGGRGGTGSPLSTQSDARGESGYGPFGAPNGGGGGGESSVSLALRRPGGGGGGSFAVDAPRRVSAGALNLACPEQFIIGLDAENGSNGQGGAMGAVQPGTPFGGIRGPRPFKNLNPTDPVLAALDDDVIPGAGGSIAPTAALFHIDDFWGVMRIGTHVVRGELLRPSAGAGGGAGGDVVASTSFPTNPFNPALDKCGAGGGGGGGSLIIFCLGTIRFGPNGRIDATGGAGAGGENTNGTDRVGGGSGGGSGGHVVLQAGGDIDFTACVPGSPLTNYRTGAGIFARGGQGGEGAQGIGGTNPPSLETAPQHDMLPPNSYPSASAPCAVLSSAQGGPNNVGTIVCAGGDGGPGVIQLHVNDLTRIKVPAGSTRLSELIQPNPIGSTPLNADVPVIWNRLVPLF